MKHQRRASTPWHAWFQACSGHVEAVVDWFALSLIGAVTGHRFDDGHSPSGRRETRLPEDSQI